MHFEDMEMSMCMRLCARTLRLLDYKNYGVETAQHDTLIASSYINVLIMLCKN